MYMCTYLHTSFENDQPHAIMDFANKNASETSSEQNERQNAMSGEEHYREISSIVGKC